MGPVACVGTPSVDRSDRTGGHPHVMILYPKSPIWETDRRRLAHHRRMTRGDRLTDEVAHDGSGRTRVRVGTFGGASAFPVVVADRMGAFRRAGLVIERTITPDSRSLRDGLAEGTLEVVHAAPDNAIAWRDGTSGAGAFDACVWLAGSNGPISLVARLDTAVAQLRGARLGVDSPHSGFAPILRRLLRRAGLEPGQVTLVEVGATRLRYGALVEGTVDASMLTLPWTRLAQERGACVLTDHRQVAPGLLTSAGIARGSWLSEPATAAIAHAYRWALDTALAWLHDAIVRPDALEWLAEDLGVGAGTARATLDAMLDPATGWPRTTVLGPGALDEVHRVRSEAGTTPRLPADAYLCAEPGDRSR